MEIDFSAFFNGFGLVVFSFLIGNMIGVFKEILKRNR